MGTTSSKEKTNFQTPRNSRYEVTSPTSPQGVVKGHPTSPLSVIDRSGSQPSRLGGANVGSFDKAYLSTEVQPCAPDACHIGDAIETEWKETDNKKSCEKVSAGDLYGCDCPEAPLPACYGQTSMGAASDPILAAAPATEPLPPIPDDSRWRKGMVAFILGVWNGTLALLLLTLGVKGTLLAWAAAEFCHYVVYRVRIAILGEPAQSHPPDMVVLNTDGVKTVQNLFMLGQVMDPWDFILPWFYHAERGEVQRDNMRDLIAYAGFYCTSEELQRAGFGEELDTWTDEILASWGVTLPAGKNPAVRIRAHIWEPLRTRYYTVLLYAGSYLCGLWARFHVWLMGFTSTSGRIFSYSGSSGPQHLFHLAPRAKKQAGEGRGVRKEGEGGGGTTEEHRGKEEGKAGREDGGGEGRNETEVDRAGQGGEEEGGVGGGGSEAETRRRGEESDGGGTEEPRRERRRDGESSERKEDEEDHPSQLASPRSHLSSSSSCSSTRQSMSADGAQPQAASHRWRSPRRLLSEKGPELLRGGGTGRPRVQIPGGGGPHWDMWDALEGVKERAKAVLAEGREWGGAGLEALKERIDALVEGAEALMDMGMGPEGDPGMPQMWGKGGVVAKWFEGGEGEGPARKEGEDVVGEGPIGSGMRVDGRATGEHAAGWLKGPCEADKLPIVFIHGIGVGLMPYMRAVRAIAWAFPEHPIITLEMEWVGMRICRVPTPDEAAERIVSEIRRLGYSRAVFMAHSYGTFVVARIIKRFPEMVHNVALLDPACVLLAAPDLLYQFVYQGPRTDSLKSFKADFVKAIAQRDPCLSATMCRKFYWHALNLWPEDIPPGAVLYVGGKDLLLPSKGIAKQMEMFGSHVHMIYEEEASHSDCVMIPSEIHKVLSAMRRWL